jgi:hypothetical protein
VGTYERLHGRVFGELDPTHRLNAGIVNLDRAARNAHGNVEYQSNFRILKPLDLDRDSGYTTCPIAATSRSCRGSMAHRTAGTPSTPATAS